MRDKKVVFFFPAFSSQEATAPLGILAVSTPLLRAGYQVRIIDSTITPNFQKRVLEELDDALCLGVSLVNQISKLRRRSNAATVKLLLEASRKPLHWLISNSAFAWPLELWLSMAKQ